MRLEKVQFFIALIFKTYNLIIHSRGQMLVAACLLLACCLPAACLPACLPACLLACPLLLLACAAAASCLLLACFLPASCLLLACCLPPQFLICNPSVQTWLVNPEFQYELKHTAHEILAGVVLRSGVHMGICSGGLGRSEASVKEKRLSAEKYNRALRYVKKWKGSCSRFWEVWCRFRYPVVAIPCRKAYEDIELAELFH